MWRIRWYQIWARAKLGLVRGPPMMVLLWGGCQFLLNRLSMSPTRPLCLRFFSELISLLPGQNTASWPSQHLQVATQAREKEIHCKKFESWNFEQDSTRWSEATFSVPNGVYHRYHWLNKSFVDKLYFLSLNGRLESRLDYLRRLRSLFVFLGLFF